MDKQYSVKFFTSFVEAMQRLCREYLDFEQGVELSGYLAVEIDNYKKERYVLSELVQSTGNVISESYCTKAFKTLRKEIPLKVSRENEHITPKKTYGLHVVNRIHRPPRPAEVTIDLRDSPEREIQPNPRYQQSPGSRGQPLNSPVRWQNRNQTTPTRINRFPSSVGSSPRMRTMGTLRSPNPPRAMPGQQPNRIQTGQQMNRMQPRQQMNRIQSGVPMNQMQTGQRMNQMQSAQQVNQMQAAQQVNQIQVAPQPNQIQPRRPEQSPTHQNWTPPRITSVQSLSSPQHEPVVIPSSPQPSPGPSTPGPATPGPVTPGPLTPGQKRPSESSDSVASPASKKDKIDENLEALIDLANMAKELSSDSQMETNSDNSTVTVTSAATVPTLTSTVASPSPLTSTSTSTFTSAAAPTVQIQSISSETVPTESIRMPLPAEVKKEDVSSDPCLIIDNANDGEISLGGDSAFSNNQTIETFAALNTATSSGSFSGDTASTSFDPGAVPVPMDTNLILKQESDLSVLCQDGDTFIHSFCQNGKTATDQPSDVPVASHCNTQVNGQPTKHVHGQIQIQCPSCPLIFPSRLLLDNHTALQHYKADSASNKCELLSHDESSLPRTSNYDESSLPKASNYVGQNMQILPNTDKFTCGYCAKCFLSHDSCLCHEQTCKSQRDYLVCPICMHCASDKKSLAEHIKVHQKVVYTCNLCGAKYSWSTGLAKHKKKCHP